MVPYFGRYGCNQYMKNKPTIHFYLYAGEDENYDSNLGLGGSVVVTLAEKLPSQVVSNYHIIMDNFFLAQICHAFWRQKALLRLELSGLIVSRTLLYDQ